MAGTRSSATLPPVSTPQSASGTLLFNNADENTAIGAATLLFNTASGNTAVGSRALLNNTTGGALGNIQGIDFGPNVAVGQQALESNSVAGANTAIGYKALQSFMTGPLGFEQLGLCTAVGFQALANATGPGFINSGFGYQVLMNNSDGASNTAMGAQAMLSNTTGNNNTAVGAGALRENTSGGNNVALGASAGNNVLTADDVICIGTNIGGADVSNSCYIGQIYSNIQPQVGTDPDLVTINSSGRLGRANVSSRRYKHDIKPMQNASEAIYELKPVTFRYNQQYDATQALAFGLVAEDVAEVCPDLVGRNPKGEPESVRYDQVNAMLLNEFLKARRQINAQQKQIEALTMGLQKVSAELEATRAAPQTAANNQ